MATIAQNCTDKIVCATKRAGHDISCPYEDKVVRGFAEWAASSQENVPGTACCAPTGEIRREKNLQLKNCVDFPPEARRIGVCL